MKFLVLDQKAIEELASERVLQSVEFEAGKSLGAWLAGQAKQIVLSPKLRISSDKDEYCIVSVEPPDTDNAFVIDEASARIFFDHSPAECLFILQKLCRFAIRYWKKLRPNRNEVFVGETKAVVFPFPISNQTGYRIVIEREPDKKRLERRSNGAFLLAFRSGTGDSLGRNEEAPLGEFRKALKLLDVVRALPVSSLRQDEAEGISSFHVTVLSESTGANLPPQQGFERWMDLITAKQREFVCAPLAVPHRIEGPAGTGKTLSLILKCIHLLRDAASKGSEHRSVFIAHSEATRKSIQDLFDANDAQGFSRRDRYTDAQSLKITTLQELCAELLNTDVSESEFLDRDAMESKNAQLLYVNEAVEEVMRKDFSTYQKFLSPDFSAFLSHEDRWAISEMVQHEISVLIKGRAEEDLNKYRRLPYLSYGLPIRNEADRGLVFIIFQHYQEKLRTSAQFDTDDIVLTAAGQLNTPVWRRRRAREGFDSVFIDETHHFNMNELSIFHYLTRSDSQFPIAYSVDRSQSLGDRGWGDAEFDNIFGAAAEPIVMQSIFRSSPDVVNLAFAVTSAGATLFTNFDDPMKLASSAFTTEEEERSSVPTYYSFANDELLVEGAFEHAEKMVRDLMASRPDVLIVVFDPALLEEVVRYASLGNKPVEVINKRGDLEVVRRAQRTGRFVIGLADYVGGLEFAGAVLVGVDSGRVPPTRTESTSESANFLSYAAHNKLYVAITRAKYRVEILGSDERGPSRLLNQAFSNNALVKESH